MSIKSISIGLDRSDLAEDALVWTLCLAAETNASVQAIATWQMPLICQLPGPIKGLPTPQYMAQETAKTLDNIVNETTNHTGSAVAVEQITAEGKPGPTLVAVAKGSDLLVVGRTGYGKRHGLSRIAEVVLGSTARHCIHQSPVPVATIPSGARWTPAPNVVLGVDGSTGSLAALDWALSELPSNSTVHVVRAFEPWVGDGLVPQDLIGHDELQRHIEAETQTWVDQSFQRPATNLETAPTVAAVIATAQHALTNSEPTPDLIVLGKRGRTAAAAMVLGSVSDYTVRYSQCPVIIVPDR